MENLSFQYDLASETSDSSNPNLRFLIAFGYGMVYAITIGILNIQIENLRSRNKWWKHWILQLEIQRKTPHVFSWLCVWFYYEHYASDESEMTLAFYWSVAFFGLGALNLIRLYSPAAQRWSEVNLKGFLREDENKQKQRWPAIFSLFGALVLTLVVFGNRHVTILGTICCTSGDAFACFCGRIWPKSNEIRKGKSVAGFLGASLATAVHTLLYLYFCDYLAVVSVWNLAILGLGALFIGGMSDLLPSREIGLDDNFTTIAYGSVMWWGYLTLFSSCVNIM
jgi:dolichol kinase